MKKILLLPFFALPLGACLLNGQTTTDQITTGLGYLKADYYRFSDGADQFLNNDSWDIAFSNLGPEHAGIFVNESTETSMGQTVPGVEAYFPFVIDFDQTLYSTDLNEDNIIYNSEISWSEGAFNAMKDSLDASDYGWGYKNAGTGMIEGAWVFAIKLRNGQYRKIWFETFDGATFQFKSAKLDGTDLQAHSVTTSPGNGSPLVYFSFSGVNPAPPTNWDIDFCRYVTPLTVGSDVIPYPVAGILHNDGVLCAKAIGIDPATVNYQDYLDSLGTRLDIVGHDWKYFSGTAWSILSDRAYFVKARDNKLYKVVFTNFGGSINGTATFQRTFLTELSAAPDLPSGIEAVALFPNPAEAGDLHLAFTSNQASNATFALYNIAGQEVWAARARVEQGLNVLKINGLPGHLTGTYVLSVQFPNGQFSRNIILR